MVGIMGRNDGPTDFPFDLKGNMDDSLTCKNVHDLLNIFNDTAQNTEFVSFHKYEPYCHWQLSLRWSNPSQQNLHTTHMHYNLML